MTTPRGGQAQLEAADDACFAVVVAMQLGGLDDVPDKWRTYIGPHLRRWADLALPPEPRPALPRRPGWSSSRLRS